MGFLRFIKSVYIWFSGLYRYYFRYTHDYTTVLEYGSTYELFVTNLVGGGTYLYADNYLRENQNSIVLQNYSYGMDFWFILTNNQTGRKAILKRSQLNSLFMHYRFSLVTVNTLVTCKSAFTILDLICNSGIPYRYFVHDYFCICPSVTLFENGNFCNFKYCSISQCFSERKSFIACFAPECKSPDEWQNRWSVFLAGASEVRCFSVSSKEIILTRYPSINAIKISVVPHSMEYCAFSPVEYQKEELIIGIVGAFASEEKGRSIVRRFLEFAKENSVQVRVIGIFPKRDRVIDDSIKYTGRYAIQSLQSIIESERVNSVLFPSVCPETFSYLVSELMLMHLPVVSFNCGAQAEKIGKYDKGIVSGSLDPEEVYKLLKKNSGVVN